MPVGADAKREREFKELESRFRRQGRYPGREEEVAARIVNKQRARYGETKAAQKQAEEGSSPDRGLPIRDYQHLTVDEVVAQLARLSPAGLKALRAYEAAHKNRRGVLEALDARLN